MCINIQKMLAIVFVICYHHNGIFLKGYKGNYEKNIKTIDFNGSFAVACSGDCSE